MKVVAPYNTTPAQTAAINSIVKALQSNDSEVLYGVTGSGKTFMAANVIQQLDMPTIVICHNKTLAYQVFMELKGFFPDSNVHYYISAFDFYRPEFYSSKTDVYKEKESRVNAQIQEWRIAALTSLCTEPSKTIIVSSVSCIFATGNPKSFTGASKIYTTNQVISKQTLLHELVDIYYSRNSKLAELKCGEFCNVGDNLYIKFYNNKIYRLELDEWDNKIITICLVDERNKVLETQLCISVFPCEMYVTDKDDVKTILTNIQTDLDKQYTYFISQNKDKEAKRLMDRTTTDIEMIRAVGYCSGMENYGSYFNFNSQYCLLDFFPDNYLCCVDESHATIPLLTGMSSGQISTKRELVEYGFRLPNILESRPLTLMEFENRLHKVLYISATPSDYNYLKTDGSFTECLTRPTGILDPTVTLNHTKFPVDDLVADIRTELQLGGSIVVNAITKKDCENLQKYLVKLNINAHYLHSELTQEERQVKIEDFKCGNVDVIVGVNLLREGIDLPRLSLVSILDADKEGFLRNVTTLLQLSGRAARNVNGRCVLYCEKITKSIEEFLRISTERRNKQIEYNKIHNITSTQLKQYTTELSSDINVATNVEIKDIKYWEKEMKVASKNLDFLYAAQCRDILKQLKTVELL